MDPGSLQQEKVDYVAVPQEVDAADPIQSNLEKQSGKVDRMSVSMPDVDISEQVSERSRLVTLPVLASAEKASSVDHHVPEVNSTATPKLVNAKKSLSRAVRPNDHKMRGHFTEITVASLALSTPLVLSAVLLSIVYANVKDHNVSSFYSPVSGIDLALGNAYFVDYSATRLVFVSSLSSTLAIALVPAATLLFSYPLAFDFQKSSDTNNLSRLPSPYQLELLIRLVGGNTMDLWRYLTYLLGGRKKRVATAPVVSKAVSMLMFMQALAVLIILADTWLHISASSVEFTQVQPQAPDARFTPGRGLPEACLNRSEIGQATSWMGCLFEGGGSGAAPSLLNSTESYLTLGNQSSKNNIFLYNGSAILGPASPPANTDFAAKSYASSSSCQMVTAQCGTHFIDPEGDDADRNEVYNCNSTRAGLDLSGNFSALWPEVLSSGTGTQSNYVLSFTYYNTSAKTDQSLSFTGKNVNKGQFWWGLVFALPPGMVDLDSMAPDGYPSSKRLDVVSLPGGQSGGIMSCGTDLSDVVYEYTAGQLGNVQHTPMNDTASAPFSQAIANNFGSESLGAGLVLAAASAKSPEDFTIRFAQVFDRTVVGLPSGSLLSRPPLKMSIRSTNLVARVPRAPFIALVLLNLLLTAVGILLASWAFWLCRFGVRDVQARLSIGALVAEVFESPDLNTHAKSVDDLYAERQGLNSARVAICDMEGLGRRYTRVGVLAKDILNVA